MTCIRDRLNGLPLDPLNEILTTRDIMNEPDNLSCSPNPMIHIPIDEDLPAPLPRNVRSNLFELAGRGGPLDLHGLLGDLVAVEPGGVAPAAQDEFGIRLLGLDDLLLDILVDGRLDGAHEAGAHVDALGAQADRRGETLAVREPAAGDEGHGQGLSRAGQQDEVRDVGLADVAGAFEAVDGEVVDAQADGGLRVSDRGAFVEDLAVGGFELLDYRAGGVAGCFDDADPLVDHHLRVGGVVRWDHGGEEGEVYGEGGGGHGATAADLFAEVFGRGLGEGCELI